MKYLIELKQTISTVKGSKLKLETVNQINELTNHLECKSLRERIYCIESRGFDILVIWEKDWKSDKQGTIKRCLDFLNS